MQQRNYQREMDALIASLDARPRLLLHSCCGPCSSACLERLAPHFDIDVFFYNPNILPAEEWEKRLFWQKHLLETAPFGKNVGLIVPERDEGSSWTLLPPYNPRLRQWRGLARRCLWPARRVRAAGSQ